MLSGRLRYITDNPATDAYRMEEESITRRNDRQQAQDLDLAFREDPRLQDDPHLSRLASIPGSGEYLAGQMDEQQRSEDDMERLAITALGNGDMEVYEYWAGRSGLNVDPRIVNDARMRTLFSQGSLVAERLYGSRNPQQAARFLESYISSNGNPRIAYEAAGMPAGRPGVTADVAQEADQDVGAGWVTNSVGTPVRDGQGYGLWQTEDGGITRRPFPEYTEPVPDAGGAPAETPTPDASPGFWSFDWLGGGPAAADQPPPRQDYMPRFIEETPGFDGGQPQQWPGAPPVGHVEQGYQYVGGDPGDPNSWRPVP